MRALLVSILLLAPAPLTVLAQQDAALKPPSTSVVSGRVLCGDTNTPARLAKVILEPAETIDNQGPDTAAVDPRTLPAVQMSGVQTLTDGSFSIRDVAPGAYYVISVMPGYISPFADLGLSEDEVKKLDEDAKKLILKRVPRVVVQANLPASIDVTLERGAAVSGTVFYDDGSPAAGLSVQVLVKSKDKWVRPATGPMAMLAQKVTTDDRGIYRINALPAHEYIVEADLSLIVSKTSYFVKGPNNYSSHSYSGMDLLPVYSGNVTRYRNAAPFKLKLGEERTGEDLQIPLSKLRTVSGNIVAARDGHIVNSGWVELLHADDRSQMATLHLSHDETSITFNFVPDGDYILRVSNAADVEYQEKPPEPGGMAPSTFVPHTEHSYDQAEQPLHVDGDLAGLTIAVPEKQSRKP